MKKLLCLVLAALLGNAGWAEFIQPPVLGQVHASTFVCLTNGDYVAAWFQGTKESAPDVAIWGARRVAGQWEAPHVFAKVNAESPHWNPVLRIGDDGRLCLYFKVGYNEWRTYLEESRDEGRTWSEPRELIAGECWGGRGPVRNKCLRLKSGRWLAPASREVDKWRCFIDRSDDDGKSWMASAEIAMPTNPPNAGVIQPTLWVDPQGVIHAYMRSNTGKIWESASGDDGVTWSEVVPTELPNNNSGIDLVKASDGALYLALNPITGNWASRATLEIWKSTDEGKTWNVFTTLEKEKDGEFSYPCLREVRKGVLAVSYTWRRKRIAFWEIELNPPGVLKAGFARRDITPPLGSFMPGYYVERYAKSVLDPLSVNMVAFSAGEKVALFGQYDTEAISEAFADSLRTAIATATGVDRDAILLHASHTHDGGDMVQGRKKVDEKVPYVAEVIASTVEAAQAAIADLKPARLSCGWSSAKRISFVRRYLMKNGQVQTNPGTNNPDVVRPVGTADETVQVLRVDREGGKALCIINFQTHPDVVGGETITADWPGLTREVFEAATFGETQCVVINGMEGDVNHCNVLPRPGELNGLKREFDAVDRGYDHAKHMANVLAAAAMEVWMKCVPLEAGAIRVGKSVVEVPAQKAKETDEKNLAWANEIWELHAAKKDEEITRKFGYKEMGLTTEVARAGRIRRMADHADFHQLPLYAFAIGGAVAFGGFPGEPFNEIGVAVRKGSPFKMTILACQTNASRGYFPLRDSYEQGGYESATSPFGPSVAADLIKGELSLLEMLYPSGQ